ncbi:MAG: hypothetical protein ACE360_09075 [Hyphomicrobiales bacterium]
MAADTSHPALPPLALSVRQPSAWAIIHGGKVIENRSKGSIRSGNMDCRRIAIHAAVGLTEKEYRWSLHKLHELGVACPPPADLPRGAIIGSVNVVDIVSRSESPWFSSRPGNQGLVLENPVPCDPIPSKGKLGYFSWERAGQLAEPAPWMRGYGAPNKDEQTLNLFNDLEPGFKTPPEKPWGED